MTDGRAAAGGKFGKGNKASKGRKPGTPNRRTLFEQTLLRNEKELVDAVVACAKRGDPTAQLICAKYLGPAAPRRASPLRRLRSPRGASVGRRPAPSVRRWRDAATTLPPRRRFWLWSGVAYSASGR